MKHLKKLATLVAVAGALTLAGKAYAQSIDGSPHDLGGGSANDNGEICVYCHTPHGAVSTAIIDAPLWNKPATGATYTTYDSTTIDGDILAAGSVSLACLTCHDGTQARNAVANAPGQGPGGGTMGAGAASTPLTGFAALGTDLTDDHPIGIQYGGFDPGGGVIDPDFHQAAGRLEQATINGQLRWWVDTEATPNTNRDKTDMILYTRDNGGTDQPFVECASCHDPHEANGTATEVNFLRLSNANSAVCLACHVK